MGLRIRRSGRLFQGESSVYASLSPPCTGVDLYQSANRNAPFLLGTAVVVIIAVLVLFLS